MQISTQTKQINSASSAVHIYNSLFVRRPSISYHCAGFHTVYKVFRRFLQFSDMSDDMEGTAERVGKVASAIRQWYCVSCRLKWGELERIRFQELRRTCSGQPVRCQDSKRVFPKHRSAPGCGVLWLLPSPYVSLPTRSLCCLELESTWHVHRRVLVAYGLHTPAASILKSGFEFASSR